MASDQTVTPEQLAREYRSRDATRARTLRVIRLDVYEELGYRSIPADTDDLLEEAFIAGWEAHERDMRT